MVRLVVDLGGNHIGIVLVAETCVGVNMLKELLKVALLRPDGRFVNNRLPFRVAAGEACGGLVGLGIARSPESNGGDQNFDVALFELLDEVIEQAQVLVLKQGTGSVGDLRIPHMHPKSIEAQASHVVDILVDGFFQILAQGQVRAVAIGKGNGIVHPKKLSLFFILRPAHYAMGIYVDRVSLLLVRGFLCTGIRPQY
ncbi:hypothetical protein ADICEAN_02661 [Cesiribacter andamanensis AMV16]|uniref:Uncharacterized protein n=1 Tax=Cesiribacter andamanensis AMV16 TaxID=1279009 RepID=M7N4N1_9BACT|nr:hypothetical protein ADICEAN_02661 [Cesiribacter andamanensis AMV16]